MTANERLEALLNRAGQTISDLPTWGGDMRRLGRAKREALTEMGDRWTDFPTVSADEIPLLEYILRLTDIIDRMEWALENAVPLKPLAKWLAGYSFPPDEIAAERWEDFLRGMDWRADDADD